MRLRFESPKFRQSVFFATRRPEPMGSFGRLCQPASRTCKFIEVRRRTKRSFRSLRTLLVILRVPRAITSRAGCIEGIDPEAAVQRQDSGKGLYDVQLLSTYFLLSCVH